MLNIDQFPIFLRSYEDLHDHLDSQLEGQTGKSKGDIFADFATKIVPLTDIGVRMQFTDFTLGKSSHDEGVDITFTNEDKSVILYIQCKLRFKGVDELDTILSKFRNFYHQHHKNAPMVLPLFEDTTPLHSPKVYFMIITLSKLERILPGYERSSRSSKEFYEELKNDEQIYLLDGPSILPLVQAAYRKLHILPTDVKIHLDMPFMRKDNVYIGIISAKDLKEIYDEFGDAIFLENIRSFLGLTRGKKKADSNRETVNEAILETATQQPGKMLAKNNGITFRANKVHFVDDKTLLLEDASIVNGCQTTMCLILSPKPETFILVKIVETSDSWDIAKAANFQNRVEQIELELASYIRPQVLKGIGNEAGFHVEHAYKSVFDVFSSIYQDQVAYEEIYYLFIGLFSRSMNNVFNAIYTELRSELLEAIQSQTILREDTFRALFDLYKVSKKGMEAVGKTYVNLTYKSIFQRFWKENKPNYRAILIILAISGCIEATIYDKNVDLRTFIKKVRFTLDNNEEKFIRYYKYSFEAVALHLMHANKEDYEIFKTMYDDLKGAKFDGLYRQLRLLADGREKEENNG